MSGPAHSCTATIPNAAAASRAASRASRALRRVSAGRGRRRAPGGGRRRSAAAAGRSPRASARPGASRRSAGRGRRGVHVDAGQVGGPVADHGVQVVGARRASFSGQPDSSQPCPQIGPSGCARA